MRVYTQDYLRKKKAMDESAAMFGEPIETVDWNGGFTPLDKFGENNLRTQERNFQERFDLQQVTDDSPQVVGSILKAMIGKKK